MSGQEQDRRGAKKRLILNDTVYGSRPIKVGRTITGELRKMFAHSAQIGSKIKTYDQPTYETKIEGNRVKVRM
jgi:hypothetical protein